jgi:hypothetical protein
MENFGCVLHEPRCLSSSEKNLSVHILQPDFVKQKPFAKELALTFENYRAYNFSF